MQDLNEVITEIEQYLTTGEGDNSQSMLLAGSYASWCRSANDRLRKCLSLFRKRQIQDGLAVAQEAPALIALVDRLKFADLPKWLAACRTNGWATPQEIPDAAIAEVRAVIEANVQAPAMPPIPVPQADTVVWATPGNPPLPSSKPLLTAPKPTGTIAYLGWGLFVAAVVLAGVLGYGWSREAEENRTLESLKQKYAQADADNQGLTRSTLEAERQLRQLQNTLSIQSATARRLQLENDLALKRVQDAESRIATLTRELETTQQQPKAVASGNATATDLSVAIPPKNTEPLPTVPVQQQSKPITDPVELAHWQGDKLLHPTLSQFDSPEKADDLRLSLDGDVPADWRVTAENDGKTLTLTHKASSASFAMSLALKRAEICGTNSYSRNLKTYTMDASRAEDEMAQLKRTITDLDAAIASLQRFARTQDNNRQLANRVTLRQAAQERSKQVEMMIGIAKSRIEAMESLPQLTIAVLRKTATSPICTLAVTKNDLR